ncbi:MAG TPA: hypothetical protein VM286_05895 [Candidatus Thermoplasmatota archaeon]|nr:hypothetical protein [Candidatus Thermoplasmatota archaeon]
MAATDTIVGIAGAVLLAAVMVGVFVYEYNNAPAAAKTGDAATADHFRQDYPALDPMGDIDGDGSANYQDPDMDGDHVDNLNDTATAFSQRFTGNMPAPSPPQQAASPIDFTFRVENGTVGGKFTLTYSTTTPAPLPGAPTLTLELRGGDATASSPVRTQGQGSTAVTVVIDAEALAPGTYTLHVAQSQPGPATDFAVESSLDYGLGHAAPEHQH